MNLIPIKKKNSNQLTYPNREVYHLYSVAAPHLSHVQVKPLIFLGRHEAILGGRWVPRAVSLRSSRGTWASGKVLPQEPRSPCSPCRSERTSQLDYKTPLGHVHIRYETRRSLHSSTGVTTDQELVTGQALCHGLCRHISAPPHGHPGQVSEENEEDLNQGSGRKKGRGGLLTGD